MVEPQNVFIIYSPIIIIIEGKMSNSNSNKIVENELYNLLTLF